MRLGHTACRRGKRVRIILRDGTALVDQFMERSDKAIYLKNTGKISKKDMRSFSIYKGL